MGINLEKCRNKEDVTIYVSPSQSEVFKEIVISFTMKPAPEALYELQHIGRQAGFKYSDLYKEKNQYTIRHPEGWDTYKIAEEIAVCFETVYQLKVKRIFITSLINSITYSRGYKPNYDDPEEPEDC